MIKSLTTILILLGSLFCFKALNKTTFFEKEAIIKGITMVAPPRPFTDDPIDPLKAVNAEYIALVPYGYSRKGEPSVRYNIEWQWWGEKVKGIEHSIDIAQQKGVKIMLKPQVYIPGGWVGEVDFDNDADWKIWEKDYRSYIMTYAEIAAKKNVAIFCIGTEYKIAVQKREAFWRQLIKDVRAIYPGKVVYSSNWDAYNKIPIWDVVDYVGISSYFPLSESITPTKNELRRAWKPVVKKLKKFSYKKKKKILFTEYGYMSVDRCAGKAWEIEKQRENLNINQKAQANAYNVLLETFWDEDFWAGGFLWKWFPNMEGHEGYPKKDYTPQGKEAEAVIENWYGK